MRKWLLLELTILFILIPIALAIEQIPGFVKLVLPTGGVIYCLILMYRKKWFIQKVLFSVTASIPWKTFLIRFGMIVVASIAFVLWKDSDNLFKVLLAKPLLWFVILFVYSFFSVYPQELLYRTFFFERYSVLFNRFSSGLLIFINATLFALAHLLLKNELVLVITFIGGLLFGITYHRSRSLLLTSVEHAVYGSWLFTVGAGDMLAFPSAG